MKKMLLCMVAALGLCACDNLKIDVVRTGTLIEHENITIGYAFETGFGEGKWSYFKTAKGTEIVEFNGLLGKNFHIRKEHRKDRLNDEDYLKTVRYDCPDSLKIQFTINHDGGGFEITYSSWDLNEVLEYAYSESGLYEPLHCYDVKDVEFEDARDGEKYKAKTMPDGKTWMTDGLRYKMEGSYCFRPYVYDSNGNSGYGDCQENERRFYTLDAAKNACPKGWRLPSREEFDALGGVLLEKILKHDDGFLIDVQHHSGTQEGVWSFEGCYELSSSCCNRWANPVARLAYCIKDN